MRTPRRLTATQLRTLERDLRSERARLERAMVAEESAAGGGTTYAAPRAPTDADGGIAVALETRAVARHQALVDALRRIEDGTYGDCASCGQRIPYGRLAAMPEASRCVACSARVA
jgi:DnaK suppressor protein